MRYIPLILFEFIQFMRNRNKYDWSKPFKFVDSKRAFDELDTNEESLVISIPIDDVPPAHQKEEIPVPKIDIVRRITEVKSFAKITPNYIRLPPHLNLPSASNYELSEVDHTFLKSHQDRFLHRGKRLLTADFLRRVFIELQMKAGKDMVIPRSKGWMMSFLEREGKELLNMDNVEIFADVVYNYWKNRREDLRFPLLRLLWKPSPEEYNHMLAFRPREREKRSLRRTNRIVEDEIIEELFEEFDISLKAVDRVQMREELKYRQVQLQLAAFYNDCRGVVAQPEFVEEVRGEERARDRERIKKMHADLDGYRNRKESVETVAVQESQASEVDQKLSIANFLSTVAYEAELLGINYEKIFAAGNFGSQEKARAVNSINPSISALPEEAQAEKPQTGVKNPEQYLSLSMKRSNDLLIRGFDRQQESHVRPCKDYLEYKRRKVDRYYFGSDDEGETKDIRKNIAASFKKFQQLQQSTRTYSAVSAASEN